MASPAKKNAPAKTMTCQFRVEKGEVILERSTTNFPIADFSVALDLLAADLDLEKQAQEKK